MAYYYYIQPAAQTLFRLVAYVFLRLIPSRLLRVPIPVLFVAHLAATARSYPALARRRFRVRRPNALAALALGLPTKSRAVTAANIAINSLLLAAVLDLAASPLFDPAPSLAFTRVGAVYPDTAKIVARHPAPADHALQILFREATTAPAGWRDGPWLNLTAAADWVATASLTNLWPATDYQYVLATADGIILQDLPPHPFRTFPDPLLHTARPLRFVASSCTVPNFPYRGPAHRRDIKGYDLLADHIDKNASDFMLFLGDFIYADVPFYFGDDPEAYRRLYRRNYASPSFARIYDRLPVFHAYDDHEIIDNFAGNADDAPPFPNAANAYDLYAGQANYDPVQPGANYYAFNHGDAAFFVLDTRRYRSPLDAPAPTMLGERQLVAFHEWLTNVNHTASFKFVVSSVPFTELFTFDAKIDTWAAFPDEKARVLNLLQSVQGAVVISGDRHQFAAVEFPPPRHANKHSVLEVSTSPLSQFYIPLVQAMDKQTEVRSDGVPRERVIEYIPAGNYKWSTFQVDSSDPDHPRLTVQTMIDGHEAFRIEIEGMPVKTRRTQAAIGALVNTDFVGGLWDRLGVKPTKWF